MSITVVDEITEADPRGPVVPEGRSWTRAGEGDRPLAPLARGTHIEGTPYVVVRLLGQGGMGEVYEVEHRELGRRYVLKFLHRDLRGRRDLAARLRAEARSLAKLGHPNLVDVFDLASTPDGRPYFAMKLLRGRDLRAELAKKGVISVRTALRIMVQALDGLEAAHAAGIIHRDVKLENLFLCDDGTVKVLDFGIAKIAYDELARTGKGVAVGTPRTMAPEQFGSGNPDARTDVYGAGLALYELLTGRGPFDEVRRDPRLLRYAHSARNPPAPSSLAPQPIPPAVDAVVLRAIAKAPADRFPSARAMADALAELLGERRRRRSGMARVERRLATPTGSEPATAAERRTGSRGGPPTATFTPVDDPTTEQMTHWPEPDADASSSAPRSLAAFSSAAAGAALAMALAALLVALHS
jgi:eukaryotic-like serine/threonine-protein kinase